MIFGSDKDGISWIELQEKSFVFLLSFSLVISWGTRRMEGACCNRGFCVLKAACVINVQGLAPRYCITMLKSSYRPLGEVKGFFEQLLLFSARDRPIFQLTRCQATQRDSRSSKTEIQFVTPHPLNFHTKSRELEAVWFYLVKSTPPSNYFQKSIIRTNELWERNVIF